MKDAAKLVGISVTVFKVLAWVSLVLQGALGIFLLVTGGEPVPVGGADIPARAVGVLNMVAAGIYFFMLMLVSAVLQLVFNIHGRVAGGHSTGS